MAAPASTNSAAMDDLGDFRIVRVSLGRAVDIGNDVIEERDVFSRRDPIYAVVVSTGTNQGLMLSARWLDADGQLMVQNDQRLVPNGPMLANFRLQNPNGWTRGHYRLEIAVDGKPVQSKDFEIR